MLPSTSERVSRHTAPAINERIARETVERVAACAARGPAAIHRRLAELDHEWDTERVLEANASSLMLLGVLLGAGVDRRWFVLPGLVSAFLLQHALQGWCPPIPIIRRLGVRTAAEIERERVALKALRGDFAGLEAPVSAVTPQRAVDAAAR